MMTYSIEDFIPFTN